jgi:Uma2 family endonuclease
MSTQVQPPAREEIEYPDSDGQPMAENTLQWEWIATIKGGLAAAFREDPSVFVAGDLLWYPVEGDNKTRTAPDVLVAIGRPKGYRGSYMQWREGGQAPQVVFEVLSPGNRAGEMEQKFRFYERFGVEEYYLYDPETYELRGYLRDGGALRPIANMDGWISPRLGIRFEPGDGDLRIIGPDGRLFVSYTEVVEQRDELAHERDELAHERDELAHERDELAKGREAERLRAERLAAKLRALGIDPDA